MTKTNDAPTPGPWSLSVKYVNAYVWKRRLDGRYQSIAEVRGGGCREVAEANGKLMAAAPEMLETLKWLNQIGGLGYEAHARIEAAIKKAT